jgi:hypothetical protein
MAIVPAGAKLSSLRRTHGMVTVATIHPNRIGILASSLTSHQHQIKAFLHNNGIPPGCHQILTCRNLISANGKIMLIKNCQSCSSWTY